MLSSIYLFFRKEPHYFQGLCAILVFYGFYFFVAGSFHKSAPRSSKEITAFQTAEKKWNKDMEREEAFRDFTEKKPVLASLFQIMTAFFFFAFTAGIILDGFFLYKRSFRRDLTGSLSPPVNQAWPFSVLFKVIILYMLWGIVLSVLMGLFQPLFPKVFTDNFYMIFHTLALHIITLGYMVKFVTQQGNCWRDQGIRIPAVREVFREIGVGLTGYFGVLPLFAVTVSIILAVSSLIHYEPPPHPLMTVFLEERRAPFLLGMSLLLGTVIGPIFEEIFFRGFCYPVLRNRWGKFWAMALSATFFAGIHGSGFVFWPIFVLGVALAYLYEKRRSLIASVTLHIVHNTLFITYFFLVRQIVGDRGV